MDEDEVDSLQEALAEIELQEREVTTNASQDEEELKWE